MKTLDTNALDKIGLAILTAVAVFVGAQASAMAQSSSTVQDDTIKSRPELNDISQRTTLFIVGSEDGQQASAIGSGTLIAKEGDRCVGVTNAHVVGVPGQELNFVARTFDHKFHVLEDIWVFRHGDLALFSFDCDYHYEPITLATHPLSAGQEVYLSGWPTTSTPDGSFVRQFTNGAISTILHNPIRGYHVSYTKVSDDDMAGGQVLDEAGRLVAIYGLGTVEDPTLLANCHSVDPNVAAELAHTSSFSYVIPVITLLAGTIQRGLNGGLNVEYTALHSSGPQTETIIVPKQDYEQFLDVSDRVNFYDMMNQVEQAIDTIDQRMDIVCRFGGC